MTMPTDADHEARGLYWEIAPGAAVGQVIHWMGSDWLRTFRRCEDIDCDCQGHPYGEAPVLVAS